MIEDIKNNLIEEFISKKLSPLSKIIPNIAIIKMAIEIINNLLIFINLKFFKFLRSLKYSVKNFEK